MVAYSHYEMDNRVRRYAGALVDRGDEVDVVALNDGGERLGTDVVDGVNLYRVQDRLRNEKGKFSYLYRLCKFFVRSSIFLTKNQTRRRYDVIHVHNVPDFLVFSAWYSKLVGAKIILDVHDLLPEFFANKFHRPENSPYVRVLKLVELLSARFADHVIISNHLWFKRITSRSVASDRCSVLINHVDSELFSKRRNRNDGKFVMLYHGGLQAHQGLDIAIRAFSIVQAQIAEAEFHIYGGGSAKADLEELIARLGLKEKVLLRQSLPADEIAQVVADADLGVVAKRADSFGNEAYSTKIMEFMASGIPVVVSRTKIDNFYFNDSIVRFFESGNEVDLAAAIICLIQNPSMREELAQNALRYVSVSDWNSKKHEYLDLVDSLAHR